MADKTPQAPAPPSPRRTRPSNQNKHPAAILKPERKRRTKHEKAADDQRLKEAQAARSKAAHEGIEHLAAMEVVAEQNETEARAFRPQPVRPKPRLKGAGNPKSRSGGDQSKSGNNGMNLPALAPVSDGQGRPDGNGGDVVIAQKVQRPGTSLKDTIRAKMLEVKQSGKCFSMRLARVTIAALMGITYLI